MKAQSFSLMGALLGLAIVTGCATETPAPSSEDSSSTDTATSSTEEVGELNLYSSRHYDSDQELYEKFSEKTGIKINLIEGKDDELFERIKTEGDNSPADVLITVDVARLWRAQSEGILAATESEVLEAAIPEQYRSEDDTWFGLTRRARVIVYNTDNVTPGELSTYEDLADPKWAGRFCVRSSSNTYNQSLVASKIVELGEEATEEWAKGLVSNFAREPEGNDTAQIKAVSSGECDVALVNSYYVARLRSSEDPADQDIISKVDAFFPNQESGGTHVNISGAGMLVNAPNGENAKTFLEYMVTPEAQEIFANNNNEYAVVEDVAPNDVVALFGDWNASGLALEGFGENNAAAVKLMDRAGWK